MSHAEVTPVYLTNTRHEVSERSVIKIKMGRGSDYVQGKGIELFDFYIV